MAFAEETWDQINAHRPLLVRFIKSRIRDYNWPDGIEEDLAQEAILSAWKSSRKGGKPPQFSVSTYMGTIAANVIKNQRRSFSRRGQEQGLPEDEHGCEKIFAAAARPADRPEKRILLQQIFGRVDKKMPPEVIHTFLGYYSEGYSTHELAALTGEGTSTHSHRLKKAQTEISQWMHGSQPAEVSADLA